MFEDILSEEQTHFSTKLLSSLTNDNFIIKETRCLQLQTELLKKMCQNKENHKEKSNAEITMSSEILNGQDDSEDSFQRYRQEYQQEDICQISKTSLFADCKLRRIQEEDEVLDEIRKKCSQKCLARVKGLFQHVKRHTSQLKQIQIELQISNKMNEGLFQFKQQNNRLKQQLQKAISKMNGSLSEKQKLRVQQQKILNKEAVLLKTEMNMVMKEKRVSQIKKKIQLIYQHVGKSVSEVKKSVNKFKEELTMLSGYQSIDQIVRTIQNQAKEVSQVWSAFGTAFRTKLQ